MDRRLFLQGASALALGYGLTGCRRTTATVQLALLSQSIPSQLVGKFQQQTQDEIRIALSLASTPQRIFERLQEWTTQPAELRESLLDRIKRYLTLDFQKPGPPFRLASLGDYWLTTAIQQELIRPLAVDGLKHWQSLPQPWQRLVQRDRQGKLAKAGEYWGAPYRWGATVIGYRKDKFRQLGWTPTDWQDLWKPELQNHLSLLAQPREVIGLTLKKLGYSYNQTDLTTVANLKSELQTLDQQAKFYSSTNYLQPLILGDTWLAVGWSTDLLPIAQQEPDIEVIIPKSGTTLWADCWVCPKQDPADVAVMNRWMDFWWQPEIAESLSSFSDALSPVFKTKTQKSAVQKLFLSDPSWFEKSDFLEPLSAQVNQQYLDVWNSILR
jgi:putative spermidine/putrescine transport system substrate-binding protein